MNGLLGGLPDERHHFIKINRMPLAAKSQPVALRWRGAATRARFASYKGSRNEEECRAKTQEPSGGSTHQGN
jgi:hypothetical protein